MRCLTKATTAGENSGRRHNYVGWVGTDYDRQDRPKSIINKHRLAASFLDLRAALADLELRDTLANDVDSATTFDDLAIWVAVLQRADAAYNFHRIDLKCLFG